MVDLPSGTVTFLLSDIQGSTRLWELSSEAMASALARHDSILGSIISERGGTVVKSRGEGDSFFAVFPRAADGLAAATEIQLALQKERWPTEAPIRVRMALHSGEVQLRDGDYYGRAVNRCARLRAIAHGGQVLVSRATAELVWDSLSEGVMLRDLGSHLLRDLERPEVVYQVEHAALPGEFPPLESLEVGGAGADGPKSNFVGREREMEELRGVFGEALAGRGQLVMLVGEPGIGKTRTAEELVTAGQHQGAMILWGHCYEQEGAPPFWPWVQAIRSYVRAHDSGTLRSVMGAGAAHIAEAVPEIRERLPGLVPPPALDSPEANRFRLFDSITTFLKNAAQNQPLALVLDDLHWADRSSLLLLEFVASEMANAYMLIVGTYRDVEVSEAHPLASTLGNLIREPVFHRVQMQGLTRPELGEFLETIAGVAAPAVLVEALHAQTEGNPLFVGEIARGLRRDELEKGEIGSIHITEGIRQVMGRRLEQLSEPCKRTLTAASVMGREFGFEPLARLTDNLVDELLDVIDEGIEARVIEELAGRVEAYRFSHALIQQTLMERLTASRRLRLHGRIGEALEEQYSGEIEAHAAQLAYHFAQAQAVLGTEKLVRYSLLAGEQALAAYASLDALEHFERALAGKEGQPMDAETADILFGVGRAQAATFDRPQRHEAVASLSRAFDYYAEAGDVPRAVAVAETPMFALAGEPTGSIQIISRALELVPPDSHEAGRLMARHGSLLGQEEGDYNAAQETFNRALTIAQSHGDVALEVRTLANTSQVYFHHGRIQETIEKGLLAIELASRIDDPRHEATARYYTSMALPCNGDLEGARRHATALLALAERLRDRQTLATAYYSNQYLCLLEGDWDSARDYIDRGLASLPTEPRLLFGRVLLEYEAGDFGQGRTYLDRFLEAARLNSPGPNIPYAMMAMLIPVVARISGVMDRFDIAEAAADSVLSSPSAAPVVVGIASIGLVLVSVQRDDVSAAEERYTALDSRRITLLGGIPVAIDRLLGLLSQTMGKMGQAAAHFEDALAFCRGAGYQPELAWTCCDYADALLQRKGESDRAKAMSLLDESLGISRELGMRPLMERVLSRRETLRA